MFRIIAVLLVLLPCINLSAQKTDSVKTAENKSKLQLPYKTWSVTLTGGITHPYTDIKYRRFLGVLEPVSENQWGVGANATYMFNPAFGIQGSFLAGALAGVADSAMDSRTDWGILLGQGIDRGGVYFKSNFYQGSVNLYWNITNTIFGMNKYFRSKLSGKPMRDRKVSLYTFLGAGINAAKSEVYRRQTGEVDTSFLFKRDYTYNFVVPVGLGLKFKASKSIDVGLEASYNFTFTDELDGFRFDHPNKRKDDFFSYMGVTVSYKIGTKKYDKEHTEWRNPTEILFGEIERLDKKVDKLYKDEDGDGVSDVFDKEPNTAEGMKVYGDGSSVDNDGDGIPDKADLEPFSDKDAKVDEFGRSLDGDNDGVPDHRDLEPNTAKGNLTNFQGITIGKPAEKDTAIGTGTGDPYLPSVFFAFDQSEIQKVYHYDLQQVARVIRENAGIRLRVVGYCDEKGNDPYNDDLGIRRAKEVISYLSRNYNFPEGMFVAESRGKRKQEKTKDYINRRVDFEIIR